MTQQLPSAPNKAQSHPLAIVGGGVTGMAAALALAALGSRVALVVRDAAAPADPRTAALFPGSVQLLRNLGVWERCAGTAAPLAAIRILDDTGWLLKAPETVFRAEELGQAALAWNIPNSTLGEALAAAVAACAGITRIGTAKTPGYRRLPDRIRLDFAEGGGLDASLVVAADGRDSPLRGFAVIAARRTAHDQTALVTSFRHSRPHHNVSNEIHRDAGPLTTVPMPGERSSLVWVERPREAARLAALGAETFRELLQLRLLGLLGRIDEVGPRMTFALTSLAVDRFAQSRIALIGEAAHVLPPIGAQGLNLGLRDVAELADVLQPVLAQRGDPGAHELLEAYDRRRRLDASGRKRGVELLNSSLASGTLPLQLARGIGLYAINAIGPLKRAVMRGGANGLQPLPSLMRAAR